MGPAPLWATSLLHVLSLRKTMLPQQIVQMPSNSIGEVETGLNVPPIDLYLTSVKAAFEKRLEASGMASYISQASQTVKTHLRKRGLYKQQQQPAQPDISKELEPD